MRRCRPGHVTRNRELAVNIDAVGRCHADCKTGHFQDVREHARCCRLAVCPGYCGNRHSFWRLRREQHVDNRTRHISGRAFARRDMHAETRACVNFANRPTRFAVRQRDIVGQKVHAANVETDGPDRPNGHFSIVRMDDVGNVLRRATRGQVSRRSQVDDLTHLKHGIFVIAAFHQQPFRLVIELEARQYFFVAYATAWIFVNYIDEFSDAVFAIADNMTRLTFCRSDKFAIHHQQAMVESLDITFDDNRTAMLSRFLEAEFDFLISFEVDRNATTMVTVQRLKHDWKANAFRSTHCLTGTTHDALLGHRQTEIAQDAVSFFLVSGELHCDVAGTSGGRGLNTLLVFAMAELHQAVAIQPNPRNIPFLCGVDERRGTRTQCTRLCETYEPIPLLREIPIVLWPTVDRDLPGQQAEQQLQCQRARLPADRFVFVLEHHVVPARLAIDRPGSAIRDG